MALALAPLTVAITLTLIAFILAGMSETTRDGVIEVTLESALAMVVLCYGFTLTFGVAGTAVLWLLDQRGPLAWGVAGVLCGAIAGLLFGGAVIGAVERPIIVGFAVAGMAIFLLIRALAGIQTDRPSG